MGEEIRKKAKVVHKHETAANWALSNYVPEIGEIVFYDPDNEFDYTRQKNGNGVDKVADLPFENDEIREYTDEKAEGIIGRLLEEIANLRQYVASAIYNSVDKKSVILRDGMALCDASGKYFSVR